MVLHLARELERSHHVHEMVVSSAVETIFRETAMFTKPHAKAMARRTNRASHGAKSAGKEKSRVRETENHKENPNLPRVRKVATGGKNWTLDSLRLPKPEMKDGSRNTRICTDVSH